MKNLLTTGFFEKYRKGSIRISGVLIVESDFLRVSVDA